MTQSNWFEPNAWDRKAYPIFIFGIMKFLEINSKNMYTFTLMHG